MPRRDARLRIEDMIEAIQRIERYSAGLTAEQFREDQKTLDAVVRNIEVVGEAAGHLDDEVTSLRPAVPWSEVRAMRNVLLHEYFGVTPQSSGRQSFKTCLSCVTRWKSS